MVATSHYSDFLLKKISYLLIQSVLGPKTALETLAYSDRSGINKKISLAFIILG